MLIHHGGDDEEQVIFWGPDVDPSKIAHLCPIMDKPYWWEEATKWQVVAPGTKFLDGPHEDTTVTDRPPLFEGSFRAAIRFITGQ